MLVNEQHRFSTHLFFFRLFISLIKATLIETPAEVRIAKMQPISTGPHVLTKYKYNVL